ncbi:CD48 antigen-like isoform X2 [Hemibagrus wyckioides]|uniref:CD48 antigen-like isoform X2 n=1 Tax=Hemibagrus wyckioides TaxID=337641 RepID=UPI00266CAD08|nr:CD48 antigen-like isoform X2 [Hemibagrus wyckioides]
MATIDRSLVLCFLLVFCVGCAYCETVYVATGKNHTFKPEIPGSIELGSWKHTGNLVVDWEAKSDPNFYPKYKGRASVNTDNGELTLQVKKEDSGVFKAEIQIQGTLKYFQSTLEVMDPVPAPKVTCTQVGENVTLQCSVDPPAKAEFKWTGPNSISYVGNSVHIPGKPNEGSIYFCIAKNQVNENVTEFKLKDCHYKETEQNGNAGVIVGSIFGVLGVIAAALGGFFLYKHNKGPHDLIPGK